MIKRLAWSGAIAAVWIISMIHAEHVGMREQVARYDPQVFDAYHRGLKDGVAIWKPQWEQAVDALKRCRAQQSGVAQ